jgi:hypothetical protein
MRPIIDTEEERDARIDKIFEDRHAYRSLDLELAIRKALVEAQNDAGDRALDNLAEKAPPMELPITAAEVEAAAAMSGDGVP